MPNVQQPKKKQDAAPWRAARIARARLLGETRDALRLLLAPTTPSDAAPTEAEAAGPAIDPTARAAVVVKAIPAFLRPRVLAAWETAAEDGFDPVAVALEAIPAVEMGPDVVVEEAAAAPSGQEDGDAVQLQQQQQRQRRRRLAAAVSHVVDGGGLKPELLLELLALLGGGRAARP